MLKGDRNEYRQTINDLKRLTNVFEDMSIALHQTTLQLMERTSLKPASEITENEYLTLSDLHASGKIPDLEYNPEANQYQYKYNFVGEDILDAWIWLDIEWQRVIIEEAKDYGNN